MTHPAFRQMIDEHGNLHIFKNWTELAQPAKPDQKLGPPAWGRKQYAAHVATELLKRNDIDYQYTVYATGGKMVKCRGCGLLNFYQNEVCEKCSRTLTQPKARHSSVVYEDGEWVVRIGRNITQTSKIHTIAQGVPIQYGMAEDDWVWVTFINTCVLVAPILFVRGNDIRPHTFSPKTFETYEMKLWRTIVEAMAQNDSWLCNQWYVGKWAEENLKPKGKK